MTGEEFMRKLLLYYRQGWYMGETAVVKIGNAGEEFSVRDIELDVSTGKLTITVYP